MVQDCSFYLQARSRKRDRYCWWKERKKKGIAKERDQKIMFSVSVI